MQQGCIMHSVTNVNFAWASMSASNIKRICTNITRKNMENNECNSIKCIIIINRHIITPNKIENKTCNDYIYCKNYCINPAKKWKNNEISAYLLQWVEWKTVWSELDRSPLVSNSCPRFRTLLMTTSADVRPILVLAKLWRARFRAICRLI